MMSIEFMTVEPTSPTITLATELSGKTFVLMKTRNTTTAAMSKATMQHYKGKGLAMKRIYKVTRFTMNISTVKENMYFKYF